MEILKVKYLKIVLKYGTWFDSTAALVGLKCHFADFTDFHI